MGDFNVILKLPAAFILTTLPLRAQQHPEQRKAQADQCTLLEL